MKDVPSDDEGPLEVRQMNRLMHVHKNLGHPSNRLLVKILKDAKVPESVIEKAATLECPICERMKLISPSRPANPTRAQEVGEILAIDFSYHQTPEEERFLVANLIDEASKFHIARIVKRDFCHYSKLGNCDARELTDVINEWARYLPLPRTIHVDEEAVFNSDELKA